MKIAILSCNTGGGHNAAAALAEELSARGHESRTYNTLDFLPKGAADLISRGHDFAYRYAPKLYGAGYRMEEKRPSPLLYENSIRGIGPLYEALVDLGADAAICVHVFPAMMMTELRCGYGLRMPTWFVATDFTCSPGVGELQLDGICIPHPALTPEFQAAGLPAQRIFPTGIPIRRQFCQTPDRDAARRQLCDRLSSYAGFTKCRLVVVFDGYKQKGNPGEKSQFHNIQVVYTKEGQTADAYIEALAHEIGRDYAVRVASSDGLVQLSSFGSGVLRMSARELHEEVEAARAEMQKHYRK